MPMRHSCATLVVMWACTQAKHYWLCLAHGTIRQGQPLGVAEEQMSRLPSA